jgi:O-antigen/teichoic acid export membrane protein
VIFPTALAVACLEMGFAGLLVDVFGSRYGDLRGSILVLASFAAIQALSGFFGVMLVAVGLAYHEAVIKVLRIALFMGAFHFLWARYELLGAVIAWGIAEVSYHSMTLYLLTHKAPSAFTLDSTYIAFVLCLAACFTATAFSQSAPTIVSVAIALGSLALFVRLAGYDRSEIRDLIKLVVARSAAR